MLVRPCLRGSRGFRAELMFLKGPSDGVGGGTRQQEPRRQTAQGRGTHRCPRGRQDLPTMMCRADVSASLVPTVE